jgi:hypothetical protein
MRLFSTSNSILMNHFWYNTALRSSDDRTGRRFGDRHLLANFFSFFLSKNVIKGGCIVSNRRRRPFFDRDRDRHCLGPHFCLFWLIFDGFWTELSPSHSKQTLYSDSAWKLSRPMYIKLFPRLFFLINFKLSIRWISSEVLGFVFGGTELGAFELVCMFYNYVSIDQW